MPEPTPKHPPNAVFLSYAREDLEAVRHIAEALRGHGIEVWLDQEELRGGDAWDAKIRRQIAECALFVPIISAHTQARREGYFRIEWRRAAQRTHAMAEGTPFIVPVVIDDTHDTVALVPDEFKNVQWTRLPGGRTSEDYCTQLRRMLKGEAAFPPTSPPALSGRAQAPRRPLRKWLLGVAMLSAVAGLTVAVLRTGVATAPTPRPVADTTVAKLLDQARALLNRPDLGLAGLDAASALCRQATGLEPNNAAAWALWSEVDVWYQYMNFDTSAERIQAENDKAARAIQLASASYEARYAQLNVLVRGDWSAIASNQHRMPVEEIETLLRERPDDPQTLYLLGMARFFADPQSTDKSALERLERNPDFAVVAAKEIGYQHYWAGRWREAEAAADRSFKRFPYWDNAALKIRLALRWHGDPELAKSILEAALPLTSAHDDAWQGLALEVQRWRRDAHAMQTVLDTITHEWLSGREYHAPKAFLAGLVRRLAGQPEAARNEFHRAIEMIDRKLALEPNNAGLLSLKAEALYYIGERLAAEKIYRRIVEIGEPGPDLVVLFQSPQEAVSTIESHLRGRDRSFGGSGWYFEARTAADLRCNPTFDPLRTYPGFADLVRRTEADPELAPK